MLADGARLLGCFLSAWGELWGSCGAPRLGLVSGGEGCCVTDVSEKDFAEFSQNMRRSSGTSHYSKEQQMLCGR